MNNMRFTCLLFICLALNALSKTNISSQRREECIDYAAFYAGTITLETERVILRQITLDDAEDMFKFASNPEVETWNPEHKTIEDTKAFIESLHQKKYEGKEPALWGIEDKQTHKLIGYCGYTVFRPEHSLAELEYVLDKPYWGKGLMPEILKAILNFTFNVLKINRIIAFTVLGNIRSERVLIKSGFEFEGLHKEAGYTDGAFWNMKSYALIRRDYLENKKS